MPRKGTEGWLEYENRSSDILTTEQDLCWNLEAMEIDDVPDVPSERSNIEAERLNAVIPPGVGGRLVDLPDVSEENNDVAAFAASTDTTCAGEGSNASAPPENSNDRRSSVGTSLDKGVDLNRPFYFGIPWEQSLLLGPADRSADLLLTPPSTPWFESALFRID